MILHDVLIRIKNTMKIKLKGQKSED